MARKRDEPVRLTKIYTRGGDRGETSLGDGSRTSKLDPRIVAYGAVDELNSHLGVVLAEELPDEIRAVLARVQNELFDVGADLSVPCWSTAAHADRSARRTIVVARWRYAEPGVPPGRMNERSFSTCSR